MLIRRERGGAAWILSSERGERVCFECVKMVDYKNGERSLQREKKTEENYAYFPRRRKKKSREIGNPRIRSLARRDRVL